MSVLTMAFCCSVLAGTTYALLDGQGAASVTVNAGTVAVTVKITGFMTGDGWTGKEVGFDDKSGKLEMNAGCSPFGEFRLTNSSTVKAKWMLVIKFKNTREEVLQHLTITTGRTRESGETIDFKIYPSEKLALSMWDKIDTTQSPTVYVTFSMDKEMGDLPKDTSGYYDIEFEVDVEPVYGNTITTDYEYPKTSTKRTASVALATPNMLETRKYGI